MGILLTKLWKLWFSEKDHKVIIVGLDNAGKTTVLYQLILGEAVHTSPTIGSNVEEVTWRNIRFVMWDIGGQESLRNSWSSYYSHSKFIILVIDSTDVHRLDIIKKQLFSMLTHDDLAKAAILILANKQDLKDALSTAEISSEMNLTSIKTHRWQIQKCCALTGEGIDKGLEWIASHI